MLVKTLLSPAFKNEDAGHTAEQIDTEYLKIYCIVHCAGKPVDKATELFCILQDGGFEKHEYIAAGDKDFEPTFLKLANFATLDVFRNAADAGFAQNVYTEEDCNKLIDDGVEIVRDNFLDQVYDVHAKLLSKEWVKQVSMKANWIFNSS